MKGDRSGNNEGVGQWGEGRKNTRDCAGKKKTCLSSWRKTCFYDCGTRDTRRAFLNRNYERQEKRWKKKNVKKLLGRRKKAVTKEEPGKKQQKGGGRGENRKQNGGLPLPKKEGGGGGPGCFHLPKCVRATIKGRNLLHGRGGRGD